VPTLGGTRDVVCHLKQVTDEPGQSLYSLLGELRAMALRPSLGTSRRAA
jgi:hypothetical protein